MIRQLTERTNVASRWVNSLLQHEASRREISIPGPTFLVVIERRNTKSAVADFVEDAERRPVDGVPVRMILDQKVLASAAQDFLEGAFGFGAVVQNVDRIRQIK